MKDIDFSVRNQDGSECQPAGAVQKQFNLVKLGYRNHHYLC